MVRAAAKCNNKPNSAAKQHITYMGLGAGRSIVARVDLIQEGCIVLIQRPDVEPLFRVLGLRGVIGSPRRRRRHHAASAAQGQR
jgi:hypothetical protein